MTECEHKRVEIESKLYAVETRDTPAEYLQRGVCQDCGETMEVEDIPAPSKTRAEIDNLKAQWKADPCWDIESTDGYEAHFDELKEFAQKMERQWADEYRQEVEQKAKLLECSILTAKKFISLEARLEKLENANA